ncbi:MAG: ribosomal protein S6, small subunit ribosomal protein S6 [Candidatus Peregrinibacteria bacterium GW2011_GWC2_39_14]|nr:MAG: 30S ribosomal protein S6 [Candidatus Peregrinibacteria bacterium GW2011_GWA2_38_36]KKR04676.1 MAG: ribosomal protein S6, small subunit ribosomal protein S6 [Candidatus Peregrinibacteria bacterium GW2011_GWC2_39_14]
MARLLDDVQNYELMFVLSPELGEANTLKKVEEIKATLKTAGKLTNEDVWGMRDLAYRIRKQDRGFYVVLNFSAENGKGITELDRTLRLDAAVLRHMILKTPVGYELKTLKDYEAEAKEVEKLEAKELAEKEQKAEERLHPAKIVKKAVEKVEKVEEVEVKKLVKKAEKVEKEEVKEVEAAETEKEEKSVKAPAKKAKAKEELSDVDEKLKRIMDNPDLII